MLRLILAAALIACIPIVAFAGEETADQIYVEHGTPGALGHRDGPGLSAFEVRAHEDARGPALDVLSRAGVADEREIPAVAIHNYSFGPGIQIDQVSESNPGLIIKQAVNGRRMPESDGEVSDAAFLAMTRADADPAATSHITVFDKFGNLVFHHDPRQRERSITTLGSDLRLAVDPGKVIIAEQPIVVPRVSMDQDGRLFGALGMLNGNLATWNGERWLRVKYVPIGKRANLKRYAEMAFFGGLGAGIVLVCAGALAWLFRRRIIDYTVRRIA